MVGMNGSLLARLVVQSVSRKKILDVQKKDEVLEKIRKTVESDSSTLFSILKDRLLVIRMRICLPNDKALNKQILSEEQ